MMKIIWFCLFVFTLAACSQSVKDDAPAAETNGNSQEQQLKNAIAKYPDSLKLVENLSAYYLSVKNYDAALAVLQTEIAKDSTNAQFHDYASIIYAQKADTANAIKSLQSAISISPNPAYVISLAALYAQTKNEDALRMADVLLNSKSGAEKEAYFIKGLYYSFNNEKEKAIPFFDKCINLNYTFMDAHLEKAIALYDLNKYEAAAEVLEKALTIQNNYDKGYYYLGRCFEKLQQKADAIEAYQMALQIDPNYEEAQDALSRMK